MTRVSLTLAMGLLWTLTFGVVNATPCTQKYRAIVNSLSENQQAREYCYSLPSSQQFDSNKSPSALKAYKYEVIQTICDCVKQRCDKLPRCNLPQSTCRKPCGGYCASLGNDENNCGACGIVCGSGQKCIAGKCTTPQPTCPKPTKWWCDGACVDRRTDKNHCGGCGKKCGGDLICQNSKCKTPCREDAVLCNGVCVYKTSLSKDKDHCGDCNTKCTDGQSCVQGKCVTTPITCSSGFELCDGGCKKKDTYASDASHCGSCNVKCSGTTKICKSGTCVECRAQSDCESGKLCQNNVCVTPPECTNDNECSRIGKVCKSGRCVDECRTAIDCSGGKICSTDNKCVTPPTPEPECSLSKACTGGKSCQEGICVLPTPECSQSKTCTGGKICQEGVCVLPIPEPECSQSKACTAPATCQEGVCVLPTPECSLAKSCTGGKVCQEGVCVPPTPEPECSLSKACTGGKSCQDGVCVPPTPEPKCSQSKACTGGKICQQGACVPPPSECSETNPCASPATCVEGVCIVQIPQLCSMTSQCTKTGELCNDGLCGQPKTCVLDTPVCPADQQCQPLDQTSTTGICQETPRTCVVSATCRLGESCMWGLCHPTPSSCSDDFGCGEAQICDQSSCIEGTVCSDQSTCQEGGKFCFRGFCRSLPTICSNNNECPTGFNCEQEACVAGPKRCDGASDCSATESCLGNTCSTPPTTCRDDGECPAGKQCYDRLDSGSSNKKCETNTGVVRTCTATDTSRCRSIEGCNDRTGVCTERTTDRTCSSTNLSKCFLGERCISGTCSNAEICTTRWDCNDGEQLCNDGTCGLPRVCSQRSDCASGQRCNASGGGSSGRCEESPPVTCLTSEVCTESQESCRDGICQKRPATCSLDSQCGQAWICGSAMTCVAATTCTLTSQCGQGSPRRNCIGELCLTLPATCRGDAECGENWWCDRATGSGVCAENKQCNSAGQCSEGQSCIFGNCRNPPPSCDEDAVCPVGQYCPTTRDPEETRTCKVRPVLPPTRSCSLYNTGACFSGEGCLLTAGYDGECKPRTLGRSCPTEPNNCLSDEDCFEGSCREECTTSADCSVGTCDNPSGYCFDYQRCESAETCPSTQSCIGQRCQDPPSTCSQDDQCPFDQICAAGSRPEDPMTCKPRPLSPPERFCTASNTGDCLANEGCLLNSVGQGTCKPRTPNRSCFDGCFTDERCLDGTCREICFGQAECSVGTCDTYFGFCFDGYKYCNSAERCPATQSCIDKKCVDPPEACMDDSQCPFNHECAPGAFPRTCRPKDLRRKCTAFDAGSCLETEGCNVLDGFCEERTLDRICSNGEPCFPDEGCWYGELAITGFCRADCQQTMGLCPASGLNCVDQFCQPGPPPARTCSWDDSSQCLAGEGCSQMTRNCEVRDHRPCGTHSECFMDELCGIDPSKIFAHACQQRCQTKGSSSGCSSGKVCVEDVVNARDRVLLCQPPPAPDACHVWDRSRCTSTQGCDDTTRRCRERTPDRSCSDSSECLLGESCDSVGNGQHRCQEVCHNYGSLSECHGEFSCGLNSRCIPKRGCTIPEESTQCLPQEQCTRGGLDERGVCVDPDSVRTCIFSSDWSRCVTNEYCDYYTSRCRKLVA